MPDAPKPLARTPGTLAGLAANLIISHDENINLAACTQFAAATGA